jgi:hypothetical protein
MILAPAFQVDVNHINFLRRFGEHRHASRHYRLRRGDRPRTAIAQTFALKPLESFRLSP